MGRRHAARRPARGGERIQAPRPARVALGAAALTAYVGVVADALARSGSMAVALVPGAALGTLLLVLALVRGWETLGASLLLAGATYVSFLVGREHHRIDATAPLVAVGLLLCGELSAWSLDERWPIQAEARLAGRRGVAVGALALGGLAVATFVVALGSARAGNGLAWTAAGAAAAVGAAGTGIWLSRR